MSITIVKPLVPPTDVFVRCDRCGKTLRLQRSDVERELFGWLRVVVYPLPDAVRFELDGCEIPASLIGSTRVKDFCPECPLDTDR